MRRYEYGTVPGRGTGVGSPGDTIQSYRGIRHRAGASLPKLPWALIAPTLTVGAGALIALVAIPGVRATTGVSGSTAVVEGVVRGLIVALPLAVGLYCWRLPAHARFGRLLVAFCGVWFLASLSSSASPFVYSVGRIAAWIAEVALGYALLAFPTGRLEGRIDRTLIAIAAGVALILFLPTALLVDRYPSPSPWTSCDRGCPHNAFMVIAHQPGFVDGFVDPLRGVLIVIVFVSLAIRLTSRIVTANTLMRRTILPVLAVSSVRMFLFAVALLLRGAAPHAAATHATMWALALLVPGIALAFLAGLLLWRMFVTSAIQAVHAELHDMPGPQQVRDVLAGAFEDPDLEIGRWLRKRRRWVAADGSMIDRPAPASGRYLTEVNEGKRRVVAILHDAVLRDDRAFIDVAASIAAMAFAGDRLTASTAGMLRQLRASRSRIAAAADSERRRIERDLHDGAQQRLVALRIQLELAAEEAQEENPAEAESLRELGGDVDLALEDIRSLARGIYPAMLSDHGLADALRSAALRSPIAATVHADGLTEYPEELSTAVYFCCVEALQNAAKHARGATAVRIVVEETNFVLRFSVSDNGVGFLGNQVRVGAGIINMQDRLATVGGELTVRSRPGHGTLIGGRIPMSPSGRAKAVDRHVKASRAARGIPRRGRTR